MSIAVADKQTKLSQLRDGGQRSFIVVRIVRLWDSIIPPRNIFTGIDFLAVDDKGFAMHGTIPAELADDFHGLIKEGHVYRIQIFEVGPRGRKTHLAIPLEALLYFNVSTVIEPIPEGIDKYPSHYFRFASYDDVMARNEKLYYLTDVIGVLTAATDVKSVTLNNNRGTSDKREIFLTLQSGQKIKITVWDPKIVELDITSIILLGYKPVLAIGGISIRDNQAYKQINTCSGTKFLLEPNLPESFDVRKSIPDDGKPIELLSSADVDNLRDYTYPDAKENRVQDLLYMNAATIKGLKFKVKGKILRFQTKQGWYYNSCKDCTFGVKKEPSGYNCPRHGDTSPRMNLKVSFIIQDGSFKLQTVVFGNLAKKLTGIDISNLTVSERLNLDQIPAIANSIIGKEFEFILGVSDQGYGPGLNFKVFYFDPVEQEQDISFVEKDNGDGSSSKDLMPHIQTEISGSSHGQVEKEKGPSVDVVPNLQTEINVTPNSQAQIFAEGGTPNCTPSASLTDAPNELSHRGTRSRRHGDSLFLNFFPFGTLLDRGSFGPLFFCFPTSSKKINFK
ncbi:Nucleic acid-binding protein [Corchorus olitorius]|uniref:Nucleic acid-binding protein n=1 Tax=Corchorus olitorius TaxID=93759 RepID=A0A1R3KUU6_9ROSI|nr:Nucleic acid-binding protein [Corchorus olitorius]